MKSNASPSASRAHSNRPPEFIRTAKALLLRRRTKEAINLLRRGLNLDPNCDEAALLLGKCLVAAKRLDEARVVFERLVERKDATLEAFVLLIRVNLAHHDPDLALITVKHALEVFPDEPQLLEFQGKAELRLEDALDDTTEEEAPSPAQQALSIDPEDLPTAQLTSIPPDQAADKLADTAQVSATALVGPPSRENLLTSPDYREATDGALEDRMTERTPTPLPGDDLGFDRRPGAPNLTSAVQRFVEPDSDHGEGKRSLLQDLLGDGPPLPATPRPIKRGARASSRVELRVLPKLQTDDPDEIGGPTPADTPTAKAREVSNRQVDLVEQGLKIEAELEVQTLPAQPSKLELRARSTALRDDPTKPLRARDRRPGRAELRPALETVGRSKAGDSKLVKLREPLVHGELVDVITPPLQPTMPSAKGPRIYVSPDLDDPSALLVELRGGEAPPRRLGAAAPSPAPRERRAISRWWPLWLTLCLLAIASGTIAGLLVRQHNQVKRSLQEARSLAKSHSLTPLRKALRHVRHAADLGGRRPEVVALAAALHAELMLEFGASDLKVVQALMEEGTRLGAHRLPGAADDMALARSYVKLARAPLPEAIGYMLKTLEQHPRLIELKLLYGEALTRNGELTLSRQVLEALPVDDPQVLRARARLHHRLGAGPLSERLLRSARDYGLSPRLMELELCRYKIESNSADKLTAQTLRSITEAGALPPRQLGWAHLLLAMTNLRAGQGYQAGVSINAALKRRPVADAEFSYRASQLLLASRRFDEAHREAQEASRISPREPLYHTQLAAVDLAKDRPREVISRLADLGDGVPSSARLLQAEAYLGLDQLQRARDLLSKLPKAPALPRAALVRARLNLRAGKPYLALRELSGAERRLSGHLAEIAVIRGLVALKINDLATASRWMKTALKREPRSAEALWALAVVALRQSDGKLAAQYLQRSIQVHPYFRRSRLELGELELRLGNHEAARTQFDKVLTLDVSNFAALVGVARATVELGSKDAETYLKALRMGGHIALADRLAVRDLVVRRKWSQAIKAIKRLLRQRKLSRRSEVVLWLARAERARGDVDAAEKLYRRLLLKRDSSAAAHLGLSELFLDQNRLGSALRHALTASEALTSGIYPLTQRVRAGLQLARCYRRGDALGAAIAELQDVLELRSSSFQANFELGQIYAALNKRDRAIHHLSRAVKARSTDKAARRELKRVCQDLASPPAACQL